MMQGYHMTKWKQCVLAIAMATQLVVSSTTLFTHDDYVFLRVDSNRVNFLQISYI